jgi:tuberous sclerosis 2
LLKNVGDLLRRPLETTTTYPPLPSILLGLASHLVDGDVVNVVTYLQETRQLAPSCPDWLSNVRKLIDCFYGPLFPRCRRAIAAAIAELYHDISDLEVFRLEIVEDVVSMWEKTLPDEQNEDIIKHAWDVMSRELVLSTAAQENDGESPIAERIRNTWVAVARNSPCYYDSVYSSVTPSLANVTPVTTPNVHLRRDYPLTPPQMSSEPSTPATERINPLTAIQPRKAILAVTLLINAFNTLAFSSPQSLTILLHNADQPQSVTSALTTLELFRSLVNLLSPSTPSVERVHCPKARLVILSWLLRLRADREHRIFAKADLYDEALTPARLIWRAERPKVQTPPLADIQGSLAEKRRNRAQTRGNVDLSNAAASRDSRDGGRKESRGRTEHLVDTISRSRSRPPINLPRTPPLGGVPLPSRPAEMLWALPEKLAFELGLEAQRPSPAMTTYESVAVGTGSYWLPVSLYITALCEILVNDKDWEIVSYVLVHLPLQLSNKHFFCGPKAKEQVRKLIRLVSTAINEDRLAHNMDVLLPVGGITVVDVQGLLYHTLMVCISYHKIFDTSMQIEGMKSPGYGISDLKSDILEVIVTGLAKDEVTNVPCLEALSLAVYELPAQLAKFTSTIVEKLSQIMSNPNMAVHILELLVVIGYTPKLWSNSFRQEDYRRVFGVALKYIEHHNRPDTPTLRTSDGRDSFSLAQHVLNTAYFVIYQWFSSIRISDRATHVPFITEQLLLANRHRSQLDGAAEVCFDWLARYTYANADPKPALTFLYRSIVAPSAGEFTADRSWVQQTRDEMDNTTIIKAWKLGNAIITISTMKKPKGWIRMQARRPSGMTELVCRVENWPHVTVGDVDPDFLSLPAMMLSERPVNGAGRLSAENQLEPNGLVPEVSDAINLKQRVLTTFALVEASRANSSNFRTAGRY